jgi:hypothetical protein
MTTIESSRFAALDVYQVMDFYWINLIEAAKQFIQNGLTSSTWL